MSAVDLSLVNTELLLMEVARRFDHGIFYAVQERSSVKTHEHNVEAYRTWGNERICQGLCGDLVCHIHRTFETTELPHDAL